MSTLTKAERDALPDDMFAVPGKRKLPMCDEDLVRLNWKQVDNTQGLSDDERREARMRLKAAADGMGINTAEWQITAAMSFEAMALQMPDVSNHPNRMPFSGVLTRIDKPSDRPPGGAGGKRTMLTAAVAEAALPSLLGMAVDFTADFEGHDSQNKIGIITGAQIAGDAVEIEGFFYAKDFPLECQQIRTEKDALGFSFECDARIQDVKADIWVIDQCVFTGAAVLYKDLAAYTTTSLAAKAEKEIEMTKEEFEALLAAALKPLTASVEKQAAELAEIKAKGASLGGPVVEQVKPHVEALNAAADAMEQSGVGTDPKAGHVGVIRKMAAHLAADAVSGKVPMVYRDHDYLPDARVEAAALTAAAAKVAADEKQIADLKLLVEDLGTKMTDLKASAFSSSQPPARATISPEIKALLAKANITDDKLTDGKLTVEQVDATLEASGIKGIKAIEAKLKLRATGLMPAGKAA